MFVKLIKAYAETWKEAFVFSEAILQNAICEAAAGKRWAGQLIHFTECFLSVSIHMTTWGY